MAVNGINSNNSGMNNIYNSIFGTSSSADATGGGYSLGDYYMIKNGTYKKLMKAYYATQDSDKAEGNSKTDETGKDSAKSLLSVKSNAATLNNSLEDLRSRSLYEPTGKDENGKDTYDTDKIISNVKSFVEGYNAYIKSSCDLDTESILRKSLTMTKMTSANAKLLSEIGVKIGEDNTLTIDEEKLKNAKLTTISSLFSGAGSYGDQIQQAARQSYKLANSLAYTNNNASSYTYQGNYSMLGTTNGVMDRYL